MKGYVQFARVCSALPGTADDVAERIGISAKSARIYLRNKLNAGIVEMRGCESSPPRAMRCVYEMPAAFNRGQAAGTRPRSTYIAFLHVLRMLSDGATSAEIAIETGMDRRQLQTIIAEMRRLRLARIASWEPGANGRMAPSYRLGAAKDAKKPPPQIKADTNRRYWAARAAKSRQMQICSALASANDDHMRRMARQVIRKEA